MALLLLTTNLISDLKLLIESGQDLLEDEVAHLDGDTQDLPEGDRNHLENGLGRLAGDQDLLGDAPVLPNVDPDPQGEDPDLPSVDLLVEGLNLQSGSLNLHKEIHLNDQVPLPFYPKL